MRDASQSLWDAAKANEDFFYDAITFNALICRNTIQNDTNTTPGGFTRCRP